MQECFERIYKGNGWGNGSGLGSHPSNTKTYVSFLNEFINLNNIKSVLDFGCGDWQFSKFVDWTGVQYCGVDIVRSVIANNILQYSSPNIEFRLIHDLHNLPDADLLLLKDVLQHWSNKTIIDFVSILNRYKYCLITNCIHPYGKTNNIDISTGDFRYLDIRLEPFKFPAQEVFTFWDPIHNPPWWIKKTLLIAQ